jgi:hypothetical protein
VVWRGVREVVECKFGAGFDCLICHDGEVILSADLDPFENAVALAAVVQIAHVVSYVFCVYYESRL